MPKIILDINIDKAKRRKKKLAPDDEVWPTFIPEEDGGGGKFSVEVFDGATVREEITLTKVNDYTLEATGNVQPQIVGGSQLVLSVSTPQESGPPIVSEISAYVVSNSYSLTDDKCTITLVRNGSWPTYTGPLPENCTILTSYYWKDVPDWDGAAGALTAIYEADVNFGSSREWLHKPVRVYTKVHQSAVGFGDASVQYGVGNTDRWKRKPLDGTYTIPYYPEPHTENERYVPYGDYGLPSESWLMMFDFANLHLELKRSNTDSDPKYKGSPDLIRTETAKKLKKYTKKNHYGFFRKNTLPKKFHIALSEIGSRSTCHYMTTDGEGNYPYAYDHLQMKINDKGVEKWQSANLFYHWFDTSDTVNFKVTSNPLYSAQAITAKPIDIANSWEIYLMPRKWAYWIRNRRAIKGTNKNITVNSVITCSCSNNYWCSEGNNCVIAMGAGSQLAPFGPFTDREFNAITDVIGGCTAICIQDMYGWGEYHGGGCTIHQSTYEPGHPSLECGTLSYMGPCNPNDFDPCASCADVVTNATYTYDVNEFNVTYNHGLFWDRWPNNLCFGLRAYMEGMDFHDINGKVYGATGFLPLHFTPSESKTEIRTYEDAIVASETEALCRYSELITYGGGAAWTYNYLCRDRGYFTIPKGLSYMSTLPQRGLTWDNNQYSGFGQIWKKIEGHSFWTTHGVPNFSEDDRFSRWDNIPHGFGLSPAKAGTLCAVIRKKGSNKAYYVWRKTDEEFRLEVVPKDEAYQGGILSFEWQGQETPSDLYDGSVPYDPNGTGNEFQHDVYVGTPAIYEESQYEWGNVDQFYSVNGLRELTHCGRTWQISSEHPFDGDCDADWSIERHFKVSEEVGIELDLPIYVIASKERALLDTDKHEEEWTGPGALVAATEGQQAHPSRRFVRQETTITGYTWCKEARNNEDPDAYPPA